MTIPTSQQGRRKYTLSGLTKGMASLDEIQTLLLHWHIDETASEYAKRVVQEGILTKQTARRVQDLVVRLFGSWFLSPTNRAACQLQILVQSDGERRVLNELVFLYKARSGSLLYDFTRDWFWPTCHEGSLYLRTVEIEDFMLEAQKNGLTANQWSDKTQKRAAQGIFNALTKAGFLSPERQSAREYILYRVTDFTITYLAYDLHLAGLTDAALVEHSDWGLFGLTREQTLERLNELDERAGMIAQYAGSVVRITWLYTTMNEVIDAYTR